MFTILFFTQNATRASNADIKNTSTNDKTPANLISFDSTMDLTANASAANYGSFAGIFSSTEDSEKALTESCNGLAVNEEAIHSVVCELLCAAISEMFEVPETEFYRLRKVMGFESFEKLIDPKENGKDEVKDEKSKISCSFAGELDAIKALAIERMQMLNVKNLDNQAVIIQDFFDGIISCEKKHTGSAISYAEKLREDLLDYFKVCFEIQNEDDNAGLIEGLKSQNLFTEHFEPSAPEA